MSIHDIWKDLPPAVIRGKYFIDYVQLLFLDSTVSRIVDISMSETMLVITIDHVIKIFFTKLSDGSYEYDGWEIGDYS